MQSLNPVKSDIHFPSLEEAILKHWKDNKLIEKGLEANQGQKPFVFYDGPPFATGLPHYGHILAGTLKDIVPRYWVMKGRYVQRRWGWDCHGLPAEVQTEKELGISGHPEISAYGIDRFNDEVMGRVKLGPVREFEIAGWRVQAGLISSVDQEQARASRAQRTNARICRSMPRAESSRGVNGVIGLWMRDGATHSGE